MIEGLDVGDRLHVRWSDGDTSVFSWTWLRDHSHDEHSWHPATHQRQVFTGGISPTLHGASARIVGDRLEIDWSDDTPTSWLPVEFLRRQIRPSDDTQDVEPVVWDAATITAAWPTIAHEAVVATDEGLARWLDLVATYGFCIVTGTPATAEATEALLRRVGYVRETIFGGMWDFQADLSKADTAYTNTELRPHTDGTYSHDAPGLQLLHCLAFDGTGGESVMVDGFRIAAELRASDPSAYEVLSAVEVPGQYIGDGAHLRSARPVFRQDRHGELVQVSFNNADRAPFLLPVDEMDAFYSALRAFEALANDPTLQWRRVNPPGEAMLFDNWRVLHGRSAYTGHRHLCGGYVNREDFESRRRVLAGR